MIAAEIGQIFRCLEMLFTVVVDAALDAPRTEQIGNQNGRLKAGSGWIKMKDSTSEVEHTFRSPMASEHMEQVAIHDLVPDGVIAVEGWQALTRSGARYVLFAV